MSLSVTGLLIQAVPGTPARQGPCDRPTGVSSLLILACSLSAIGVADPRPFGAGEVRASEVRASEARGGEVRTGKVRVVEVRAREVRVGEVRAGKVRGGEAHAAEIGVGVVRARGERAAKVYAPERSARVKSTTVAEPSRAVLSHPAGSSPAASTNADHAAVSARAMSEASTVRAMVSRR